MYGKGVKLFTLFGFPVRVDASWILIALLVTWSLAAGFFPASYPGMTTAQYWVMGTIAALGLFASIVIHEFGHSMVARKHGVPMKGITLFIFGGVAEMGDEPPDPKAEFQVAVAGPITSVLIGAACLALAGAGTSAGWPKPVTGVLSYVGLMNGLLVAFNLIPALPLDGGRILRSALWKWKRNLNRATRITSNIGMACGVALIVLGVLSIVSGNFVGGLWWVLIGLFLRSAAQMSYQQLLIRRALEGEQVRQFMTTDPITVPSMVSVADLVEKYMYRLHHRMFPVTDNGTLVGSVTARELRDVPRDEWNQRVVRDVVRPCSSENTITPDADAVEALSKMRRDGCSRLLVVEGDTLQGVLTLKDLMKFLSLKLELEEELTPRLASALRAAEAEK